MKRDTKSGLLELSIKKYSAQLEELRLSMDVLAKRIHEGRVKASAKRADDLILG